MSILDEIYDYLDDPHRYERYIVCRCIFHSDSRPSLFIYEDSYRCAACNKFGSTEKLLEQLQGKVSKSSYKITKHFNNPWTKWTERYGSIQKTLEKGFIYLSAHPSEYLKRRAIPVEFQLKARLGYLDDWYLFPIRGLDGKIAGGVARAGEMNLDGTQAKYVLPAHQSSSLLYIPRVQLVLQSPYLFLTFGIIDALSLTIAGFPAASTTTGKNITASSFDWCRKSILVIPDDGEETSAMRLIAQLGWRGRLIKIEWPTGCKDVNDIAIHYPEKMKDFSNYVPHMVRE